MHAGGKFGGDGYKVSGGLHGVGASVVNALSEHLEVEVHDGEQIHRQEYARGTVTMPLTVIGKTDHTGTKVHFKPDGEIFETLVYDYNILLNRLREQAFLNRGIRITLTDNREEEPKSESMMYEGGICSFVEYKNRRSNPLHEQVIYMDVEKDDCEAEVAMQYNDSYKEMIISFANNIHTVDGGMHETGFKSALTRVLNDYAKKRGFVKENEQPLSGDDVREGLTAIISVKVKEAQFEGQTKT